MATKLERDARLVASKMKDLSKTVEAFSKRKIGTLPKGVAWELFQASLELIGSASKIQLAAAKQALEDTKAHFKEARL